MLLFESRTLTDGDCCRSLRTREKLVIYMAVCCVECKLHTIKLLPSKQTVPRAGGWFEEHSYPPSGLAAHRLLSNLHVSWRVSPATL